MSTAHKRKSEVKERIDDPAIVAAQSAQLVDLIKESKHTVVFTGAGISTSTGIPDFRGPNGVWTLKAQGKKNVARGTSTKAIPSPAHMALVAMLQAGELQHVVSQNTDGLHRRSGIAPEHLSELHGNTTLEVCSAPQCGKEFLRDYRVRKKGVKVHDHKTGRHCTVCGGATKDTIINFGENLPEKDLSMGEAQCAQADLCIVLGSSLRVTPAADLPPLAKKLVIVNLQKTPHDTLPCCVLRIYGKCDTVMQHVMNGLGLRIPAFVLRRHIAVDWGSSSPGGRQRVVVRAHDVDGTAATVVKRVRAAPSGAVFEAKEHDTWHVYGGKEAVSAIELTFFGNYNEHALTLKNNHANTTKLNHISGKKKKQSAVEYVLAWDPHTRTWTTSVASRSNDEKEAETEEGKGKGKGHGDAAADDDVHAVPN